MPDSLSVSYSNSFHSILTSKSWVKGVTQSGSVPGDDFQNLNTTRGIARMGASEDEGRTNFYHYGVKHDYFEVMNIKILEGESFSTKSPRERVMINEVALKSLGFENASDAIGQKISLYLGSDKPAEIMGVFENFYQRSPKERHIPMILWPNESGRNFIIKLDTQDSKQALSQITAIWNDVFPDHTLDYYFLNDLYNYQYHSDLKFGKSVLLFTILSILIAILGLFGLSSYMVLLRTKEMGIRKILGAPMKSLVALLSKDYLIGTLVPLNTGWPPCTSESILMIFLIASIH